MHLIEMYIMSELTLTVLYTFMMHGNYASLVVMLLTDQMFPPSKKTSRLLYSIGFLSNNF